MLRYLVILDRAHGDYAEFDSETAADAWIAEWEGIFPNRPLAIEARGWYRTEAGG